MECPLAEAYEGKAAQIRAPDIRHLRGMHGLRRQGRHGTHDAASTCGGVGKVRAAQGFFTIERTCPSCQGRGEVIETPCHTCHGSGRVTRERTLSVTIPAGVEERHADQACRRRRGGLARRPCGRPRHFLSIKPDGSSSATAPTCFAGVPIAMTTAALGGQIEAPTIDGGKTGVKSPRAPRAAGSSASKPRACRCCAPSSRATSTSRSRSRRRRA